MTLTPLPIRTAALALLAAFGLLSPSLRAETATTATATGSSDAATTSNVCIVSGEPLGSMGEPHTIQHEGRTIRFCCKACETQFKQDPQKYLQKLDGETTTVQAKNGASSVCIVSGKELPAGGGKEVVVNNQTVRLCCGGCEATLKADPEKYLGKLAPEAR